PTGGTVVFEGQSLGDLGAEQLRQVRPSMQMIFQDPISSLNPRRKVRDIVGEGLAIWGRATTADEIDGVMRDVGIDP
ncbi:MAG TPA: peptide ABC transporter ATP-binding protein, partial [Acidimicrobiales bacterium]|nr:peptide ABC transporter ATP-binding protein [Acidimicrobiales bacterium]